MFGSSISAAVRTIRRDRPSRTVHVAGRWAPVAGRRWPLSVTFCVVGRADSAPVAARVTLADLGAWLLKGNADRVDLAGRFAQEPRITAWCVQPGYRTRLMDAGQPTVFWGSGSRGGLAYGVWGCGSVTGPAELHPEDGRWHVPLDLTIDDPAVWVPRRQLRVDPRLIDAEVFRQPQGANPSYLTVDQFHAFRDHMDAAGAPGSATVRRG